MIPSSDSAAVENLGKAHDTELTEHLGDAKGAVAIEHTSGNDRDGTSPKTVPKHSRRV